jgi:hypothetical protein
MVPIAYLKYDHTIKIYSYTTKLWITSLDLELAIPS